VKIDCLVIHRGVTCVSWQELRKSKGLSFYNDSPNVTADTSPLPMNSHGWIASVFPTNQNITQQVQTFSKYLPNKKKIQKLVRWSQLTIQNKTSFSISSVSIILSNVCLWFIEKTLKQRIFVQNANGFPFVQFHYIDWAKNAIQFLIRNFLWPALILKNPPN
jgi:hypothetical protein